MQNAARKRGMAGDEASRPWCARRRNSCRSYDPRHSGEKSAGASCRAARPDRHVPPVPAWPAPPWPVACQPLPPLTPALPASVSDPVCVPEPGEQLMITNPVPIKIASRAVVPVGSLRTFMFVSIGHVASRETATHVASASKPQRSASSARSGRIPFRWSAKTCFTPPPGGKCGADLRKVWVSDLAEGRFGALGASLAAVIVAAGA